MRLFFGVVAVAYFALGWVWRDLWRKRLERKENEKIGGYSPIQVRVRFPHPNDVRVLVEVDDGFEEIPMFPPLIMAANAIMTLAMDRAEEEDQRPRGSLGDGAGGYL